MGSAFQEKIRFYPALIRINPWQSISMLYCNTTARSQHFTKQGDRLGMRMQTVAFDTAGEGENTRSSGLP
jgi:hypothetical protein